MGKRRGVQRAGPGSRSRRSPGTTRGRPLPRGARGQRKPPRPPCRRNQARPKALRSQHGGICDEPRGVRPPRIDLPPPGPGGQQGHPASREGPGAPALFIGNRTASGSGRVRSRPGLDRALPGHLGCFADTRLRGGPESPAIPRRDWRKRSQATFPAATATDSGCALGARSLQNQQSIQEFERGEFGDGTASWASPPVRSSISGFSSKSPRRPRSRSW